ncbi:MAG: TlpA disulfide reductase family protein [Candidatus Eisenbacteria bacterium]
MSLVGKAAPDVAVRTLDGEYWQLRDMRGKVVVLDFWATWCGPCRRIIPRLRDLHQRFGSRPDFAIVGVALEDDPRAVGERARADGMAWLQTCEESAWGKGAAKALGVKAIPCVCVVDKLGKIVGYNIERTLEQVVSRALGLEASDTTRAALMPGR